MVENGLYVLKSDFYKLIISLGGKWDDVDATKRPIFCCVKDKHINGLYWAIPTSDLSHRSKEQIDKYNKMMCLDKRDLRSQYYHIAYTNKRALYKISSCFPITEKYIDHEYISNNVQVVMKNAKDIEAIRKKLYRIIAFENRQNNYFPQHITTLKEYLIKELDSEQ